MLGGARMTLDTLSIGHSAVICKVGGDGPLRLRLLDMGLIPRTRVTVCKTAPLGDPIEIRLRGYELTLRKEDARNIEIEPQETGCAGCAGCAHCAAHHGRRNHAGRGGRHHDPCAGR